LQVATIYQPVQEGLAEVEKQFKLIVEGQHATFPEFHEMLSHILVGGKVIRPALTLLCGKFYNYDLGRLLPMATASELLHIATLVHDDAIDHSLVRRFRPTVNKIWGEEKAILLGDYLFAMAGRFAAATDNLRVVKLFAETLRTISRGELKQSFSAFKLKQTFDDYLERISAKTAALFSMAAESGAVLSQAPEESVRILKDYSFNLGIAFQIVDDILDFTGTEEEMGKPGGSDLTQGTLTLPAMLLLKRYPEDNPVKRLFEDRDKRETIALAIEAVRNSSVIDECYQVASGYRDKGCRNLKLLPGCPSRQSLVELADYIIQRKK